MSMRLQTQTKAPWASSFTPVSTGLLQRKCACGSHTMGGECEECSKRNFSLQRRTRNPELETRNDSFVPPIVHDVLRSPGQPLDTATRAFFEPRFSHDFSQVRVHTDARAAESAREVNAFAYTVGSNVVFGAGQYAPGTTAGKRLLAHELTHVAQQALAPASTVPSQGFRLSEQSDSFEQAADQAGDRIGRGEVASSITAAGGVAQRALFRKKLDAKSNFPDPNECWRPGSSGRPELNKTILVVEAMLETPDTCDGMIKTKTSLRDVTPGSATGWAPVIRFGISDGTQGTGGVGEATAVSEESGVVEYELDVSWAPSPCLANFDIFVYVKFPESGEFTFVEVRYSPRIAPLAGGRLVDGSLSPVIRLNPCNHLTPSPPLIHPQRPSQRPRAPRGSKPSP